MRIPSGHLQKHLIRVVREPAQNASNILAIEGVWDIKVFPPRCASSANSADAQNIDDVGNVIYTEAMQRVVKIASAT